LGELTVDEHELRRFIKLNSGSKNPSIIQLVEEARAKLKELLDG
jgi:hypothetical protein